MPQCKAKFCTVKRGQGISAFAIPDPKKNRLLCEQWIHNLGIKMLDNKTYEFSKQNIVCERHFEEECFKKDKKVSFSLSLSLSLSHTQKLTTYKSLSWHCIDLGGGGWGGG